MLALKAQSQSRATVEALAAVKSPPVVLANQMNVANGSQQDNNGTAAAYKRELARTGEKHFQHKEHLGGRCGEQVLPHPPAPASFG